MFLRLDGLVITSAGPYMKWDGKGVQRRELDLRLDNHRILQKKMAGMSRIGLVRFLLEDRISV